MLLRNLLLLASSVLSTSAVHVHPHPKHRRATGISVKIADAGGTNLKAIVTNTGDEPLRLFSGGTVLDDLPVRKVDVFQNGKLATFTGIVAAHTVTGLSENAFIYLPPGGSAENTFDLSQSWELEAGQYMVQSVDAIPFTTADSTELTGVFEYKSNAINMTVTSADLENAVPAFRPIRARTLIQCDSPEHATVLQNALEHAVQLANTAANAATGGNSSLFQQFFRTMSASSRSNVAARFRAIAEESSLESTQRQTTYYCQDPQNVCKEGIVAYCQPSQNYIANCPIFYEMTLWPRMCNDQTQASTVVHEMTHAPGLFSPGTADHAYGYSSSTGLSADQALLNADTYALYATAVTMDC